MQISQASAIISAMDTKADIESVVRKRLKSLRLALGWSLDDLAERTHLGASTLSRIENGKRSISLDVLQPLSSALGTDLAALLHVEGDHSDVVIRPVASETMGGTVWPLTRNDSDTGVIAAKWRLEPHDKDPDPQVHPGHDWFFVLSGTVRLVLGDQEIMVRKGEAAEFSTMTPHQLSAHRHPAEIITIFDRTGHQAHLRGSAES